MDIIGFAVGMVILVVIGIPVLSAVVTVMFTAMAAAVWFTAEVLMYLVGIPFAVAHRVKYGYWA